MFAEIKKEFLNNGFVIIDNIFSVSEIDKIITTISAVESSKPTFRKTKDLFAIRQFLKEIPAVYDLIFNDSFKSIISKNFGSDYFVAKSIYFDKPGSSNWLVSYHQDLTISVNKKTDIEGYNFWTKKQDQFAVQPPPDILRNNFTIRIHLDKTDESNGALKVIPGSHLNGICRVETIDRSTTNKETTCQVNKGGIMLMHPLLFHSSDKTIADSRRRVIHIEFSNSSLPEDLEWSEKNLINFAS